MEKTRSVSRCVAIAAHGRRCQQSPFRGSPYCWHHTQSRKVWAPSRLTAGAGQVSLVEEPSPSAAPARPGRRRGAQAGPPSAAERLALALGPERVEELLRFLESPDGGAFTLVREPAAATDAERRGQIAG